MARSVQRASGAERLRGKELLMSSDTQPAALPDVQVRSAEEYVADIRRTAGDIAAILQSTSDDDLRKPSAAEGWPIVVIAHHTCEVQRFFAGLFDAFRQGKTTPSFSADDVDRNNARHADEFAGVTRDETLACLQQSTSQLTEAVERLSPDQLASSAGSLAGFDMTCAQILEFALIGHFQEHLASMRQTLESA